MSQMKLAEFNRYDYTKQELIDLIGDNFRQIEHQINGGNLDASNVSDIYIEQAAQDPDYIATLANALAGVLQISSEEYCEYGSADYSTSWITFTLQNNYTEKPVAFVGIESDSATPFASASAVLLVSPIQETVNDQLVYTKINVAITGSNVPASPDNSPRINLFAICRGKVGA